MQGPSNATNNDGLYKVKFWRRKTDQQIVQGQATFEPAIEDPKFAAETREGGHVKLPQSRLITRIVIRKAPTDGGHWKMECFAIAPSEKGEKPEKVITIDLMTDQYRIYYNTVAEFKNIETRETWTFGTNKPRAADMYRIVHDVAKTNGPWKGVGTYSCQDFVNKVMDKLQTLPDMTLTRNS